MPSIKDFGSFEIVMYFRDHNPPHVHVVSADDHALVAIGTGEIVRGSLRAKIRREALEWIVANTEMLMALWSEYQE